MPPCGFEGEDRAASEFSWNTRDNKIIVNLSNLTSPNIDVSQILAERPQRSWVNDKSGQTVPKVCNAAENGHSPGMA